MIQPYYFYSDLPGTRSGEKLALSIHERYLFQELHFLSNINIIVEKEVKKLNDHWELVYEDADYYSKYINQKTLDEKNNGVLGSELNINELQLIPELKRDNTGIRFYASLVDSTVVVDIVRYSDANKTDPEDKAEICYRRQTLIENLLEPKNFVELLNTAALMLDENHKVESFIFQ